MKICTSTKLYLFLLILILTHSHSNAQWAGVYGNKWLEGKYNQSWLKISVSAKGMHRIAVSSLPTNFRNADKSKLQLWWRGEEVSLIKADDSELIFYGVPNDGESDKLLYRMQSSRVNPHYSLYSDKSAYFLTIGANNGKRAETETLSPDESLTPLEFHIKTDLYKYQNEFTHNTYYPKRPSTLNSYFEEGKTATGSRLPTLLNGSTLNTIHTSNPKSLYNSAYAGQPFSYSVKVPHGTSSPVVKILLSGRFGNARPEIFAGKNSSSLLSITTLSTSAFLPTEFSFPLTPAHYDANGGTLGFRASVDDNYFSVTYFTVTYDQMTDMQSLNSYEFNFPALTSVNKSRIQILNAVSDVVAYDISQIRAPRIVPGNSSGNVLDLVISRDAEPLKLLVSKERIDVKPTDIAPVTFQELNPSDYDYLILTNTTLHAEAVKYADYRKNDSPGRKFKTLVKNINEIYNEFNYGEPSPVAIRRYVDYMISDGNKKDKYLLIIGHSITRPDRRVRELPNEIPTIGFPGSDILLVDGLAGTPDDVPAIPVGRISATRTYQVSNYLAKVKVYEGQKNASWRKNVIHMSGGKGVGEVNSFAKYMSDIAPAVMNAPFSGNVIPKVKTNPNAPSPNYLDDTSLAPEINGTVEGIGGVGMVSYFGHGSTVFTDYNAGFATDPSRGYNNNNYPVLFYNGCGVSNVFSNLIAETYGTTTSQPMSLDWLLAPNKGAIVVFGNDWDAYPSTSNEYLDRLHPILFRSDAQRGTVGEVLQEVALETKTVKGYNYNPAQNARVAAFYNADRANVHQVLLQGDPAMMVLWSESSLPVNLISFDARLAGNDLVAISWKTASEQNNSHFEIERSADARKFQSIGIVEGKGDSNIENSYFFQDNAPLSGLNYYRLKQVDYDQSGEGNKKGNAEYSRIVAVDNQKNTSLIISPNPSSDYVKVTLDASQEVSTWRLLNIQGKVLLEGEKENRINLSKMNTGEYIIEVRTTKGEVLRRKILKK